MSTFDPVAYKRTTEQQWQDAAEAWHRWTPTLGAWPTGYVLATDISANILRFAPPKRQGTAWPTSSAGGWTVKRSTSRRGVSMP